MAEMGTDGWLFYTVSVISIGVNGRYRNSAARLAVSVIPAPSAHQIQVEKGQWGPILQIDVGPRVMVYSVDLS